MEANKDDIVCALCGADARLADDGYYRHAKQPFEDVSTFCEKYGYPIPAKPRGEAEK